MRILNTNEVKSVPYTPISHPLFERLIGSIRREFTDNILFWNKRDLAAKLNDFQDYYNHHRARSSKYMAPPLSSTSVNNKHVKSDNINKWKLHCRGLLQLPIAA